MPHGLLVAALRAERLAKFRPFSVGGARSVFTFLGHAPGRTRVKGGCKTPRAWQSPSQRDCPAWRPRTSVRSTEDHRAAARRSPWPPPSIPPADGDHQIDRLVPEQRDDGILAILSGAADRVERLVALRESGVAVPAAHRV